MSCVTVVLPYGVNFIDTIFEICNRCFHCTMQLRSIKMRRSRFDKVKDFFLTDDDCALIAPFTPKGLASILAAIALASVVGTKISVENKVEALTEDAKASRLIQTDDMVGSVKKALVLTGSKPFSPDDIVVNIPVISETKCLGIGKKAAEAFGEASVVCDDRGFECSAEHSQKPYIQSAIEEGDVDPVLCKEIQFPAPEA